LALFNTEKTTVFGYNEYSDQEEIECVPLFLPDNIGPWCLRYVWMKKRDDENFLSNYHSVGESKSNVRKSTIHLESSWIPYNCLMINQGHLGNIVWRIKVTNPWNQSVDIIEVWRDRQIIKENFLFEDRDVIEIEQAEIYNPEVQSAFSSLEQGGSGLKNGSGLTIGDPESPKFYTKDQSENLGRGLWESGFDIRTWKDYPLISKTRAIEVYDYFKEKQSNNISINTGWNKNLNPI
jgi:hypothetical protein